MDTLPPKPQDVQQEDTSREHSGRHPDDRDRDARRHEQPSREPGASYRGSRRDDRPERRYDDRSYPPRSRQDIDSYQPPSSRYDSRREYRGRDREYDRDRDHERGYGQRPSNDRERGLPPRRARRGDPGWERSEWPRDDRDTWTDRDRDRERDRDYHRDHDQRRSDDGRYREPLRDSWVPDSRRSDYSSDRHHRRSSRSPRRRPPSPAPSSHYPRARSPGRHSPPPKRAKAQDDVPVPNTPHTKKASSPSRSDRPSPQIKSEPTNVERRPTSPGASKESSKTEEKLTMPAPSTKQEAVASPIIDNHPSPAEIKAEISTSLLSPTSTQKGVKTEPSQTLLPPTGIKREIKSSPKHDRDGDVKMSEPSHHKPQLANNSPAHGKPSSPSHPRGGLPSRGSYHGRRSPPRHRHSNDKSYRGTEGGLPWQDGVKPSSATASPKLPQADQPAKWQYSSSPQEKQVWKDLRDSREQCANKLVSITKQTIACCKLKLELSQALYEVELSTLEVENAERRRKIATLQREKAIDGVLHIPEPPPPPPEKHTTPSTGELVTESGTPPYSSS